MKKNILAFIAGLLVMAIIGFIGLYIYNKNKEEIKTMTGTVIISGDSYMMFRSNDGVDYLIDTNKKEYSIGDKVAITYDQNKVKDTEEPINIDIVESRKIISYKDSIESEESTNSHITPVTPVTPVEPSVDKQYYTDKVDVPSVLSADTEVLSYLDNLKSTIDASTVKESVKGAFTSVVDFIFYNGTIKGHTFNELSTAAKEKVLEFALYLDSKVDEYFPGYKQTISSTGKRVYNSVKAEILGEYLDVIGYACEENGDTCNKARELFDSAKEKFGLSWSLIKDIGSDGISKISAWYQTWKNS